jgi:hypothetical protein
VNESDIKIAAQVLEWLRAHGVGGCRICGCSHVNVSCFVSVAAYSPSTDRIEPNHAPMVQTRCAGCANVQHYDIQIMGIIPQVPMAKITCLN